MNAIRARRSDDTGRIEPEPGAIDENWLDVCQHFNDDVHRIEDVAGSEKYTALYECFDDDNHSVLYLVEETEELKRVRRQRFRRHLGLNG